jgi:hypothetical protein
MEGSSAMLWHGRVNWLEYGFCTERRERERKAHINAWLKHNRLPPEATEQLISNGMSGSARWWRLPSWNTRRPWRSASLRGQRGRRGCPSPNALITSSTVSCPSSLIIALLGVDVTLVGSLCWVGTRGTGVRWVFGWGWHPCTPCTPLVCPRSGVGTGGTGGTMALPLWDGLVPLYPSYPFTLVPVAGCLSPPACP